MIDADGQLVMETAFLGGKPQAPTKQVFKRRERAAGRAPLYAIASWGLSVRVDGSVVSIDATV